MPNEFIPKRRGKGIALATTIRDSSMDLAFGPWLKQRRRVLDLVQEELAQQASCSLATIRKIESSDLAGVLARAFGVPAAQQDAFITFARTPHATAASGTFLAASPDSPTTPT